MFNEDKKNHSTKFKEHIFIFFSYFLDNTNYSPKIAIIFSIIECIQIMSFTFDKKYLIYWGSEEILQYFEPYLSYFRMVTFFKGKKAKYLIGYFFSCLLILLYIFSAIYVSVVLSRIHKKSHIHFFFVFLKISYTFFLYLLFLPLLDFFFSIFSCNDTQKNIYIDDFYCNGIEYYIYFSLSIIFSSFLIIFNYLGYSLFYDQIFNKHNILSKQTCVPDLILFLIKIIVISFKEILRRDIFFIVIYVILSLVLFYEYYSHSYCYNKKMIKINICLSSILVGNSICLFIGKILESYFNGAIFLFIFGTPLLLFSMIALKKKQKKIAINDKYTSSREGYCELIKIFEYNQELYKNKRKSRILFESYIFTYELHCPFDNCPLRQYKNEIARGNYKIHSLFFIHIHSRFLYLISAFPSDPFLKIMHGHFLFFHLNQPALAKMRLLQAQEENLSLSDEFLIYRVNALMDKANNGSGDDAEQVSYFNLLQEFKDLIGEISNVYISFWSSLFFAHQDNKEDLSQLNDYGTVIERMQIEIKETFTELQKLKPNDLPVLKYYSDFLAEVVNDNEEAQKYKEKYKELKDDQYDDNDHSIGDIDLQNVVTDEVQYITVSTNPLTFSSIINVNLGICVDTGYTKEELIGKSCNILLPEIMRSPHYDLLKQKFDDFKNKEIDDITQKREKFKTFSTFLINKAHFLVPITLSTSIVTNEEDQTYFIAKISHALPDSSIVSSDTCYILTNKGYIIQNYTSEAVKLLSIVNKDLNFEKNLFIGNYIKGFVKKTFDKKINQEYSITWMKKTMGSILYRDFQCFNTLVIVNEIIVGHILKLTLIPKEFLQWKKPLSSVIDNSFLPYLDLNKKIILDTDSFSFSFKDQSQQNVTEQLKQKAMKLINKDMKSIDASSITKTTSEEEEYTSSGNSEDESSIISSSSRSKSDNNLLSSNVAIYKKKTTHYLDPSGKINPNLTGYYPVKTSKIKLQIYDYKGHRFVDEHDPKYFMNSVEAKLRDLNGKAHFKKHSIKKQSVVSPNPNDDNDIKDENNEQTKLMKQIEFSMTKTEAKTEMRKLRFIGFLVFLILIAEGFYTLYSFNNIFRVLHENCSLIQYSYQLLCNCVYSIYFIRELTLLSMDEYSVTYQDMSNFWDNTISSLSEISVQSQEYTEYILTSFASLSPENKKKIYNDTLPIYMVIDNLEIIHSNLTLHAALSQTLSSVFTLIGKEKKKLLPTSKEVYFSFLNNLNGVYHGLLTQASVFNEELWTSNDEHTKTCFFDLGVFIVLQIISFWLLSSAYFTVEHKKDSYLEIFFEINVEIIRITLERCEYFQQKVLSSTKVNHPNGSQMEDDENDEHSQLDISLFSLTSINLKEENISTQKKKKKDKSRKCMNISLNLFLSLGLITLIIVIIITENYLQYFEANISVLRATSEVNIKYLMLFNAFREYLFDKNLFVNYTDLSEYLNNELSHIYEYTAELNEVIQKNKHKLTSYFNVLHSQVYDQDICHYTNEFFNSGKIIQGLSCEHATNNASSFGLSVLIPYFIEEIKEMKAKFEANEIERERKGYKYNLTLYGLEQYKDLNSTVDEADKEEYFRMSPFYFLNSEQHDHLVIIFRYILMPILDEYTHGIVTTNQKNQVRLKKTDNMILLFYLCIIVLAYVFVWKRYESKVYSTIYKAKNMLKILPKEILVNLESVHKLFNLSSSSQENQEENEE